MAKYHFEFKWKIVQEYLEGKGGYSYLAKKYSVKNKKQIENWVKAYEELGEEGLFRKRQNQSYSVQFKLDAVELYQTSELSYREVANKLEMNNPALLANWMRKFRDHGVDGLSKTKGRPSAMPQKKPKREPASVKTTLEEQDRMKALEKQVRSLQIENAFLKELRKLRKQEAQQRRTNQSHESSQASEDHSN
ncbi:transposase [Alicyclobacillus contaminans]|uniref:Transposase n=1 Tax=Tetragenococcus osmophilus TaxID=526944 RepID=A0AA37XKI3_9ENTE|nr:transposase [Alicyclobacillus contaminans]GMA71716.1 transposase [Tetragenococcus osmophilus]